MLKVMDYISEKLEGYKECSANDLKQLVNGDRVRYMKNNEFKLGGVVKYNNYPEYIALINYYNKASWCMQLKEPTLKVWARTKAEMKKEEEKMKRVYEMYLNGELIKAPKKDSQKAPKKDSQKDTKKDSQKDTKRK